MVHRKDHRGPLAFARAMRGLLSPTAPRNRRNFEGPRVNSYDNVRARSVRLHLLQDHPAGGSCEHRPGGRRDPRVLGHPAHGPRTRPRHPEGALRSLGRTACGRSRAAPRSGERGLRRPAEKRSSLRGDLPVRGERPRGGSGGAPPSHPRPPPLPERRVRPSTASRLRGDARPRGPGIDRCANPRTPRTVTRGLARPGSGTAPPGTALRGRPGKGSPFPFGSGPRGTGL